MKRILIATTIIGLALTGLALRLYLQPGTPSRLQLAPFLPGGALAYAEFRDLNGLLDQWMSSAAHKRYFDSANWKQFQRSRLYLRLNQRLEPVEAALGFQITEDRLSALAGKRSALGVYNIGQLEMLFITEMSQQQALGSDLFKHRGEFRERSVDGQAYYIREGTSAESQEKARAGFAFAQGRLLVASSESLLRRALSNLKTPSEDRLSQQVARLTEGARDFQPHDITVWLDQKRLNADRYFRNYWIQRNQRDLADIETALIDMEIADDEFRERRWFALSETAQKDEHAIGSLDDLLRFAPADTHLITVTPANDFKALSRQAANVLLGVWPAHTTPFYSRAAFSPYSEQSYEPQPSGSYGRYTNLDSRFNMDIDDPTSFAGEWPKKVEPPDATTESEERFITRLMDILQPAQPVESMSLGQAALGENRLFVYFNRALVIKLARPEAFQAQDFEKALQEEFAARYVVQGVPSRLVWKASGDVRSLSQAMLDRGGAYAVIGNDLILANRADYGNHVAQAYRASKATTERQAASLKRFAQVRIQPGKGTYKHVMQMLAMPGLTVEPNLNIDLFSDNIAGLFDVVPELSTATIETIQAASLLREAAIYSFRESR
jgi:hypothetical protein